MKQLWTNYQNNSSYSNWNLKISATHVKVMYKYFLNLNRLFMAPTGVVSEQTVVLC